jgi:hypothetical protein
MKPVETWAYALLLLVAIGLSWTSWTTEEVEEKKSSVVFDPGAGLTSIVWAGDKNAATLTIEGKDDDLSVWVEAGRRPKIEAPKGDDDDSAAGATAAVETPEGETGEPVTPDDAPEPTYGPPELKAFPGNDQATKLVGLFQPLSALREFADVDAEALEGMGLKDPKATLTLDAGGRSIALEVGDKAYGSSDTYLRDASSGAVYLVSSKVIGPLRGAESRLMERSLQPFEPTDAAAAKLTTPAGGESRSVHQGRHDKDNAYWADPDQLEVVDTARDALMDKVFQLRATAYATEAERVTDADVQTVARAEFNGEDGAPLGSLDLSRKEDIERSKPGEPVFDWWARSDRTRGQWVKVSRSTAQELSDQIDALVGG